jgi:hypothetical protein
MSEFDAEIARLVPGICQAITTRYVGPRGLKGSKIIAECYAGRLEWGVADDLSREANHIVSAHKLARRNGWLDRHELAIGSLDTKGYVFVLVDRQRAPSTAWTVEQERLLYQGKARVLIKSIRDHATADGMRHKIAELLNLAHVDPADVYRAHMDRQ